MKNAINTLTPWLTVLALFAFGCSEETDAENVDTPDEPPVMPQNLSPPEVLEQDALCMGPEPLTTVDWVESADAVAIGTVTDVSPVLEAWLGPNEPGEGEFVDPATCDSLDLALRVTMQVESHSLNQETQAGDSFEFVLGPTITDKWNSTPGVWVDSRWYGWKAPTTMEARPDGSLQWSKDTVGLSPGMRIAARTFFSDARSYQVLPFLTPLLFETDEGWTTRAAGETLFCFDYSNVVADLDADRRPEDPQTLVGINGGPGSLEPSTIQTTCQMNREHVPNLEAESPDPLAP